MVTIGELDFRAETLISMGKGEPAVRMFIGPLTTIDLDTNQVQNWPGPDFQILLSPAEAGSVGLHLVQVAAACRYEEGLALALLDAGIPFAHLCATLQAVRAKTKELADAADFPEELNRLRAPLAQLVEEEGETRKCRVCGCTHTTPCFSEGQPCSWVEWDLCSACSGKVGGNG